MRIDPFSGLAIKSESLKIRNSKKTRKFEDKAIKAYSQGKMKKGKNFEKLADRQYDKQYYNIYKVNK